MTKLEKLQAQKLFEEIKTIRANRTLEVIKSFLYGMATMVAAYVAVNGIGS